MHTEDGPFFSVIIPAFNVGKSIEISLKSIVNQQFKSVEIIVVDGGSRDETVKIVKNFEYSNIQLKLISEPDEGIYDAMNKGIDLSSGKWLLFLGADDRLHDEAVLGDISKAILGLDSPVVYGDVKIQGKSTWANDGDIYDGVFDKKKIRLKNVCHQAVFYSRNIFQVLGRFNKDYRLCADWDFNMRCFAKVSPGYTGRVVSIFNCGGASTASNVDQFTSNDVVFRIREYFQVSYFDETFKTFNYIFRRKFVESQNQGDIINALRFRFIYYYHLENKLVSFQTNLRRLLRF